jgi:hypothetical protein
MQTFCIWPLPIGRHRDTLSECQATPLWSDLDLDTFDAREKGHISYSLADSPRESQ